MFLFKRVCILGCAAMLLLATFDRGAEAQQQPIKIGIIYSYTGVPQNIGQQFDAAIKTYVDQHGDTVAGRKIVLIKRDDQAQPEVARRVAQELIVQDNVDILAGVGLTPVAVAVAQVSTQAKKPFIIANAATSGILATAPYAVRLGFTTRQITIPLAQWAAKNKLKTAFSVFQDYGPGIDAGAAFAQAFTAAGGTMLGEVRVPVSSQDYSAYVQRIKDAKPSVAFAFFNLTGAVGFVKSVVQSDFPATGIKLASADDLADENDLQSYGDGVVGLMSSGNYTSTHDSRLNREFVRAFATAYGSPRLPGFGDCAMFDVMHAIYTVVDEQKGNVDADKTIALLKGMKFESPRGPLTIDPQTRDAVQNVYIRQVQKRGGKIASIEIATVPMVKDPSEH